MQDYKAPTTLYPALRRFLPRSLPIASALLITLMLIPDQLLAARVIIDDFDDRIPYDVTRNVDLTDVAARTRNITYTGRKWLIGNYDAPSGFEGGMTLNPQVSATLNYRGTSGPNAFSSLRMPTADEDSGWNYTLELRYRITDLASAISSARERAATDGSDYRSKLMTLIDVEFGSTRLTMQLPVHPVDTEDYKYYRLAYTLKNSQYKTLLNALQTTTGGLKVRLRSSTGSTISGVIMTEMALREGRAYESTTGRAERADFMVDVAEPGGILFFPALLMGELLILRRRSRKKGEMPG